MTKNATILTVPIGAYVHGNIYIGMNRSRYIQEHNYPYKVRALTSTYIPFFYVSASYIEDGYHGCRAPLSIFVSSIYRGYVCNAE